MNWDGAFFYLPRVLYALLGLWLAFWLRREGKLNGIDARRERLLAEAGRAAEDAGFRREKLAEVENALAGLSGEELAPFVVPLYFDLLIVWGPALAFGLAVLAIFLGYWGIFSPFRPGGGAWPLISGLAAGGLALLVSRLYRRALWSHSRLWELNRKYIFQKVGREFAPALETLEAMREYYPARTDLLLEKADRLAGLDRLAEALEAVRRAREISPENLDFAFVEASFHIRAGNLAASGDLLERIEREFPRSPSDPRPNLYRSALHLRKRENDSARERLEKGLQLDSVFCEELIESDRTLTGVGKMLSRKRFGFGPASIPSSKRL
ncbi:MAG: hypothetical protein LBU64_02735 [Planctomycetota bacterium]|nr:hypothetical protein [Planctomycetota bacterium]